MARNKAPNKEVSLLFMRRRWSLVDLPGLIPGMKPPFCAFRSMRATSSGLKTVSARRSTRENMMSRKVIGGVEVAVGPAGHSAPEHTELGRARPANSIIICGNIIKGAGEYDGA